MINAFNMVCYSSTFAKLNPDKPIKQFEISLPLPQSGLASRFMIPVLYRIIFMYIPTLLDIFNPKEFMMKSLFYWFLPLGCSK